MILYKSCLFKISNFSWTDTLTLLGGSRMSAQITLSMPILVDKARINSCPTCPQAPAIKTFIFLVLYWRYNFYCYNKVLKFIIILSIIQFNSELKTTENTSIIDFQTLKQLQANIDNIQKYRDGLQVRLMDKQKENQQLQSIDINKQQLQLYSQWQKSNQVFNKELSKSQQSVQLSNYRLQIIVFVVVVVVDQGFNIYIQLTIILSITLIQQILIIIIKMNPKQLLQTRSSQLIFRDCLKLAQRMVSDPVKVVAVRQLIKQQFIKNRNVVGDELIKSLKMNAVRGISNYIIYMVKDQYKLKPKSIYEPDQEEELQQTQPASK